MVADFGYFARCRYISHPRWRQKRLHVALLLFSPSCCFVGGAIATERNGPKSATIAYDDDLEFSLTSTH